MTDNNSTSTNTNWFKALARPGAGNSSSKTPSLSLHLPTRGSYNNNNHDLPTPPATAPSSATPSSSSTPTSPVRRASNHHHHRKSAGATLRSVSSFLNIKSASSKSDRERSGSASTTASAMSAPLPLPLPVLVGPERRKLRAPAPVAMLPLTEIDWDGFVGAGPGIAGAGEGQGVGEGTWHNPGLMQTVELLGAAMARKGSGESLDVRYNSCVLSLIEGFYRLTRTLCETDERYAELKETRERELEQFRGMAEEWMDLSDKYKAEIKRLELALAKESTHGMATVALARHGSLVDRSGSKRLRARIEELVTAQPIDITPAERQRRATARSIELAEAAAKQRANAMRSNYEHSPGTDPPGSIPRILDLDHDVMLSRSLEQIEREEWRTRRQETQGRVRAGPVLVRGHGGRESPEAVDKMSRAQRILQTLTSRDTSKETPQSGPSGSTNPQPDDTPRPHPPRGFSAGSESISSESTTSSTDTESAHSTIRAANSPTADQAKSSKGKEKATPDPLAAREPPRKRGPKLWLNLKSGRLTTPPPPATPTTPTTPTPSTNPALSWLPKFHSLPAPIPRLGQNLNPPNPPPSRPNPNPTPQPPQQQQQEQRRRYSFEQGDDAVLPVNPLVRRQADPEMLCAARYEALAGEGVSPRQAVREVMAGMGEVEVPL
ncbi:hypothetical protein C8A05DRAFT_36610, partial [Staphylotrichum tortipilum]